jgi:hypothetical protein
MLPPSRNAPCPCGSGRKYKHCCLTRATAPGPRAGSDRDRAWSRLMRFATSDAFAAERGVAMGLFWDMPDVEDLPPELARAVKADLPAFFEWFSLDLPIDESGDTIVERLLKRDGPLLPSGEADFLRRMSASAQRLYEIAAVRPDEGLDLTDLWNGDTVRVRERLATRQLVRWDLLAARVSEWPDGSRQLEGQPSTFPPDAKDALLRELRAEYRRYLKRAPGGAERLYLKRVAPVVLNLYRLDRHHLAPLPVVTAGGEPLVITRVRFEAPEPAALPDLLSRHAELEEEPGTGWVWFEEAGGGMHRLLGRIELTGDRLLLETMSEERGERGRRLLEALLGERIRHLATTCEDAMEAVKRKGSATPPPRRKQLPPELEAEAVTRFLDKHYREWLDLPVPALGNRTPRHAAGLKTIRPKLEQLLRQIENRSERERLDGGPGYDSGWLRDELGMGPAGRGPG